MNDYIMLKGINSTDTDDRMLIVSPNAVKQMFDFYGWGKMNYPPNRVEQTGLLVGYYIHDKLGRINQAIVTHFFPSNAIGTPVYVSMPPEEKGRLERQLLKLIDEMGRAGSCLTFVGWSHTHPNGLPVFHSAVDKANQAEHWQRSNEYSLVVNPHTKMFCAFAGRDSGDVPCVLLVPKSYESDGTLSRAEMKKRNKLRKKAQKYQKRHGGHVNGKQSGAFNREAGNKSHK